jgi:serine/threonine-protein kinase
MGAVWGAFNLQLEAEVAIKVLLRDDGNRELLTQRLKQEAKATAKLGHPAIVRVFDVGETELGDAFIVMELLKGQSLAAVLAAEGCLPATRAVQLLLPIADALSAAHAKGLIHRDLKPDNVFLVADDDQLQPKLVDFGIVKIDDPASGQTHLTQAGMVLGSPEYMSPEQARGLEDVDHRSDIWSFCVVLYEAISGATPFAAANYNALLRSIVEDEPKPLVSRSEEESELWRIVQRGLSKAREQRFRSMSEIGRALASWLIRQGIVEDACGASLEAKWILRSSDPSALRAARASLPSFPSMPPESGVRPANDVGSAPTIDARPATDPARASVAPSAPRSSLSLTLIAVAAAIVATLLVSFALRSRSAVSAAPSSPAPNVSANAPAERDAPKVSAPQSPASSSPIPLAPPDVKPSPPTATAKPLRASATRAAASSSATTPHPSPQNDLLSPY